MASSCFRERYVNTIQVAEEQLEPIFQMRAYHIYPTIYSVPEREKNDPLVTLTREPSVL